MRPRRENDVRIIRIDGGGEERGGGSSIRNRLTLSILHGLRVRPTMRSGGGNG